MSSETDEAALAGLLRGFERLHCAIGAEDAVDLRLGLNAVHLPQIQVVRPQSLECHIQFRLRLLARPLTALRGEEDVLAHSFESEPVSFLRSAFPVAVSTVEVS